MIVVPNENLYRRKTPLKNIGVEMKIQIIQTNENVLYANDIVYYH